MDLESISRWEPPEMIVHADIPEAPWYVVEDDIKPRTPAEHDGAPALNPAPTPRCPPLRWSCHPRPASKGYERTPREHARTDHYSLAR